MLRPYYYYYYYYYNHESSFCAFMLPIYSQHYHQHAQNVYCCYYYYHCSSFCAIMSRSAVWRKILSRR
jgi:hypothetical protein